MFAEFLYNTLRYMLLHQYSLQSWRHGVLVSFSILQKFYHDCKEYWTSQLYIIPCINNIKARKGIHRINFGLTGAKQQSSFQIILANNNKSSHKVNTRPFLVLPFVFYRSNKISSSNSPNTSWAKRRSNINASLFFILYYYLNLYFYISKQFRSSPQQHRFTQSCLHLKK